MRTRGTRLSTTLAANANVPQTTEVCSVIYNQKRVSKIKMTAIDDKYAALGGSNSFLGPPSGSERSTPDQEGRYRQSISVRYAGLDPDNGSVGGLPRRRSRRSVLWTVDGLPAQQFRRKQPNLPCFNREANDFPPKPAELRTA